MARRGRVRSDGSDEQRSTGDQKKGEGLEDQRRGEVTYEL